MRDHPGRGSRWQWMLAGAAAALAALGCPLSAAQLSHNEILISGQEIFTFIDQGTPVTVVVEDFELKMGRRTVRGRDAVIWIEIRQNGQGPHQDVTVYVEGDGQVVEPGGTTTDKTLVVTFATDGWVRTSQPATERDMTEFPLYRRAVLARAAAPPPPETASAKPPARTESAGPGPPVTPPSSEGPEPREPLPAQTVDFHYDELSSRELEIGVDHVPMRATVLRGHVRITTGDPDSMLFLELHSDSAVVFTRAARATDLAPGQRRVIGGLGLGRVSEGDMILEGVYLDGDVLITRGERTFRGPTAYYDFTTDRALVFDAVFHSVQEQRNIPIYIRAKEARILSVRESYFRSAKVSTSEFYRPNYHIGATRAYLMDTAPYDEQGQRIGPPSWQAKLHNVTYNIAGVPVFYWPYEKTDFTQGHTALRKITAGRGGRNRGWGVQTEWDLFRLLGLARPKGFKGRFELDVYERGVIAGATVKYARPTYSGYWLAYGVYDSEQEDAFGDLRENLPAPSERGRILIRHKQLLPGDWELQAELSYICDRNFMEAFFPTEHFSGKEQETLLYAKKQHDNWALTALLQYRLNRFETQAESWPEVAGYLIGESLLRDRLTYFGEARIGAKRWRPDNALHEDDSDVFARLDTRHEIDLPLHLGPVNLVTYATGRATYWSDSPFDNSECRPYGQIGQRANLHIWRVYEGVSSRVWDLHGLKHIITPEVTLFASDRGGVQQADLYQLDYIEQHIDRLGGGSFGVYQRLQTKRYRRGQEEIVDWMRLNLVAGFFSQDNQDQRTSGGDFFWYRPESSLPRNFINGEYDWQISDTTALLADFNYDTDSSAFAQASLGVAVARDPRVRYYLGWRYLKDVDSSLATFGVNYKISRKYSISFFEQYDMDFDGSTNVATSLTIVRQLPRWYAGLTFTYITGTAEGDDVGLMITFWPEGIPEVRFGGGGISLLGRSSRN